MKNALGKWGLSFLLSLPVLLFLLCHFYNHSKEILPTGFIQYDNVSYAGNAKQYLNKDHFSLFYQNRLNDSGNYPKIYFQPQHLVLALFMKAGLSPGTALCIFNYLLSIVFFRILIALYDYLFPTLRYRKTMLLLFAWGGGVITLCGWLLYFLNSAHGKSFTDAGLFLDPASGWWGLNLGRSLIFSMEVFYHVLFFGAVYQLVKKKWINAAVICALLSISHPFTGLELLLIIIAWAIVEKIIYKNNSIPWLFISAMLLLTAFHLWYYLIFLNRYPEHRSVYIQYQLNWRVRFFQFIPAYLLVATCAFFSIKKATSLRDLFAIEKNRLLAAWAIVAFLLANHELFIQPMQPLHFTRGYIWSALFLLGAPALSNLLVWLNNHSKRKWLPAILLLLFLSDNIYWFGLNTQYTDSPNLATYIDAEQEEILHFLSSSTTNQTLIIGSDNTIPYLATVYTNAYSWISHSYNTPFYRRKKNEYANYILNGSMPQAWLGRDLLFIADKNKKEETDRFRASVPEMKKIYESKNYLLYRAKR